MIRFSPSRSRAGHIVTGALALLALGAGSAAVITGIPTWNSTSTLIEPASQSELTAALVAAGLVPDALAAAGVTAEQTTGLLDAAEEFLESGVQSLRDAQEGIRSAKIERDRLAALVRTGRGTPEDAAALATARSALSSAEAALDAVVEGLLQVAATAVGLGDGQVSTIRTIRANRALELPVRYLAQTRTKEQWAQLRDALTNRRVAAKRGEEPCPAGCGGCLSADADSASVQVYLEANLAGVQAAWDTGMGN